MQYAKTSHLRHYVLLAMAALALATLPPAQTSPHSAAPQAALEDLVLTEIMYHPPDDGTTPGDDFEFIEIKNTGTTAVDISGFYFDSGISFTFPAGTALAPGQLVVLASVPARFQARYGIAPFGAYTGSLSNAGEALVLLSAQGSVVIEAEYDDEAPWPIAADGAGYALVPVLAAGPFDHEDPRSWRLSSKLGGSPGADDGAAPSPPHVLVNELLAHTDPPQQDAVELHNTTDRTVSVGGWYLTDDVSEPTKYRIPTGTTIPPGGYLVLDEGDFDFGFNEAGEDVLLFVADETGRLTGTVHGFRFAASENQVSFGRYVNSVGDEHFVRQRALSFGQENAGPRPSPIVMSELMYRTEDDAPEFIELVNISDGTVPLYDPSIPQNTWRIDGVRFNFPPDHALEPGEAMLVVSSDPETFRTRHGLPMSLRVLGPYEGALSNSGERIVLQQPGPHDEQGEVPYIAMDLVTYRDDPPWPPAADGDGPSLERIDLAAYGDDPANWRASAAVGGTPGDVAATRIEQPGQDPRLPLVMASVFPNPFHASAHVTFQVSSAQEVAVTVYDVLGREVATLFDGTAVPGVLHEVVFEPVGLSSGVYTVRLKGSGASVAHQVVYVR